MNTIKHYHGLKIVWLLFYLINLIMILSCKDDSVGQPQTYEINFKNQYFEKLVIVEIGEYVFEEIEVGQELVLPNIPHGETLITIYTSAGLKITATANLKGNKAKIKVLLLETGILVIE